MEDVQAEGDARGVPLDQVGVSGIRYPIVVLDRAHKHQQTVATVALSVSLPHDVKGTHMSRFVEILEAHRREMTLRTLQTILDDLRHRLRADAARIEVAFPYFIERSAPVSGERGLLDYDCTFVGTSDGLEH